MIQGLGAQPDLAFFGQYGSPAFVVLYERDVLILGRSYTAGRDVPRHPLLGIHFRRICTCHYSVLPWGLQLFVKINFFGILKRPTACSVHHNCSQFSAWLEACSPYLGVRGSTRP